jgi:hypothetical protein
MVYISLIVYGFDNIINSIFIVNQYLLVRIWRGNSLRRVLRPTADQHSSIRPSVFLLAEQPSKPNRAAHSSNITNLRAPNVALDAGPHPAVVPVVVVVYQPRRLREWRRQGCGRSAGR